MTSARKTLGIIFMGGQGLRLGGVDKSEIMIGGQSCFDRVYRVLAGGSSEVALSRPFGGFHEGAPVIPDWPSPAPQSSPALALLGCLSYAAQQGFDHILTSSVDTPFLPQDFAENLSTDTLSAAASSGPHLHGLHARWSCELLPSLKAKILGGEHGLHRLHAAMNSHRADFSTDPFDPFFNINRPEDLIAARAISQKFESRTEAQNVI